ncbi:MAG TPA: hypothetical protein DDY70_06915 [Clostridiales bacterium]|nr:hypothetical protein [Clostridiales bacterium]
MGTRAFGKTKRKVSRRNFMKLSNRRALRVPARASLGFTLAGIFAKGIGVLTTPLFSRLLRAEEYGLYSLYLTWLGIFSVAATLGITGSVLYRGIQKYRADTDAFLSSAATSLALTFCLSLGIYLLFSEAINRFTGLTTLLTLFLFMQIGANLSLALFSSRCRYLYRPLPYALVTLGCDVLSAGLSLLLIRYAPHPETARIYGLLIASLVFAVPLTYLCYRRGKCLFRKEHLAFLFPFALSLFPHYAATILLAEGGRAVIGRRLGRAALAGYGIASALGLSLSLLSGGIGAAYQPWVMRKAAAGETEKIAPITDLLARLFTLLSCLLMLLFPEIFSLLAPAEYRTSLPAALPLACSVLPHFLASMLAGIHLTREEVRPVSAVTLAVAGASLLADALFVPRYGAVASGFVTLGGAYLLFFLRLFTVRKKGICGVIFLWRTVGLLAAAPPFALLVYVLFPYVAVRLILFALLLPTVFFLGRRVLAALKETKADIPPSPAGVIENE